MNFWNYYENAINHAKCNINGQLINIYLNNTEKLMIMIKINESCRLTNIGMQKVAILNSFIYKIFISDDTILEGWKKNLNNENQFIHGIHIYYIRIYALNFRSKIQWYSFQTLHYTYIQNIKALQHKQIFK